MDPQKIQSLMAPYREKIDDIDARLISLLRERYNVIEEVGVFKYQNGIPATLQDRVDQVRENAVKMAENKYLDGDFIRHLYAQIIQHSCDLEDKIMEELTKKEAG